MKISTVLLGILCLLLFGLIFVVAPDEGTYLAAIAGISIALLFLLIAVLETKYSSVWQRNRGLYLVPLTGIFVIIPVSFGVVLFLQGKFSVLLLIVIVSLAFSFFYNFVNIPLAIYHKYRETKLSNQPMKCLPSLSILIPAYNEEKCIAGTIETLLEAYYPGKEIIVIDDGSTDSTYQIAQSYIKKGVKVITGPNGGKASALNHGLQFARGEVTVCVDADSMVSRTALVEIVRKFEDPSVVAVAGNIKVLNRNKLITACQALEYILDINIARRSLDVFGAVVVVPGCLGAFRSEALRQSAGWDIETIVEDFDTTIKVSKASSYSYGDDKNLRQIYGQGPDFDIAAKGMKSGRVVQASAEAIGYTEAPETWQDLWKQRLRWYRGNFQVLFKHSDVMTNSRFGPLYSLSFPYMIIGMILIPISMIAVIITAIFAILAGDVVPLLFIFGIFVLLQFTSSLLALELDNEDRKLVVYAAFFVVGYKHFLDAAKFKALFDVLTKKHFHWDKLKRVGLYESKVIRTERAMVLPSVH